jgi:hypothetical protein
MREFILGLIGKLLFSEIIDWSPKLVEAILQVYAKKLPAEVAPRALEEARALLEGTPGKLIRLARALDLLRASRRISHEYYYPEIPFRPYNLMLAKMLDRLFATLGLVFFAPLLGLIAIGIKLTSSGPAFERSLQFSTGRRVGSVLRFRTTLRDQAAELEVDRIRETQFGTFLRRTWLDSLPSLWSVSRGETSTIGCVTLVAITPGDDALPPVKPERPELLLGGLIQLSPEQEQKFLQNPLGNYFVIVAKIAWYGFSGIRPRF